ncbi:ABC transporter ATP-binding protein [Thiolapillus brandeum]|uniref:Oligopeptide transporter ATP-binding protein n=1 Tax=Thiolapillus brandeum TaxID=1076588 RepID=A0A7U6GHG5_9GAMM|nr:oligopeptide/dipeptide ABC transporter ATP-binding protein [Thiolapillus brandeum]BAO43706.1 oligopeptide transporter ATP-binding protein [Thiolapillus brandeum]
MPLLEVENLRTVFHTNDGEVYAVNDLSFSLEKGETLGVVGESGSGKSQLVLSIINLLASNGRAEGSIRFQGQELVGMKPGEINRIRGNRIGMIFQDPMTCLNPYLTIERQMTEVLMLHQGLDRRAARQRSTEMLDAVHIPDAANRLKRYPHEFSGGMRQRVMIAMALLCQPDLLIADEPTTALDVTVQAQIIQLMNELQQEFGMSIVMITHDLGVIAGISDNVMVMYGGRICEYAPVFELFQHPRHPYTRGLLQSVPRLDLAGSMQLHSIPGNPPNLLQLPPGCAFADRCEERLAICTTRQPALREVSPGHLNACHLEAAQ